MKRITLTCIALLAMAFAFAACNTTDDANSKLEQCLEDEHGVAAVDDYMEEWTIECEDGDDACDTCVDCIMSNECAEILDGDCVEDCDL